MMKVAEMPVQTFVDLCKANAELGTALLKTLTEQDERYERKSAELEAMKADHTPNPDVISKQAARIRDLVSENNGLMQELRDLKALKAELDYENIIKSQADQIKKLGARNIDKSHECEELKRRLDVTNDALKEKVGVIEALDRRNKGMLSQLQDLRSDAQVEIDRLTERIASYEQDIAAHKDRWGLLRDRLQLLRDRISQNAGNVADCINYLDAFVGEVANDATH